MSVSVLVGCSEDFHNKLSDKDIASPEANNSLNESDYITLSDFNNIFYGPVNFNTNGEFQFSDKTMGNGECIIFENMPLKKSEKITLTFQLQSNSSFNHMTIGIIKDYNHKEKENYNIENIYSESIENKLTVTYTAPTDGDYSISILGTMAGSVVIKNGKITKHD